MSDDDYSLDPSAHTPHHAYIHHSRADSRRVILELTRERDEARAEVERLREVLRDTAEDLVSDDPTPPKLLASIIRTALKGSP